MLLTAAYALVLIATVCAAYVSHTYSGIRKQTSQLNAICSRLATRVGNCEARVTELHALVDKTQSAKIAAELADLAAAIDVDRQALRRQLGKLWGRIGRDEIEPPTGHQSRDDLRRELIPLPPGVNGTLK